MSGKLNESWLSSTLSNYGLLALRIGSMLVLTRSLFLGLNQEEYGFWALIWSIFSYTLLLDFGFGTAVQKWTSQSSAQGDWQRYGQLLSSLLLSYGLMGGLLALLSFPVSQALPHWFHFASDPTPYQHLFLVFGIGSGLLFPTGMAAEMLRGLGQLRLRNRIQAQGVLLQTVGSLLLLHFWPNLMALTLWTLLSTLLTNVWLFRKAWQGLPHQFQLGRPSFSLLKEVAGFSFFAWLITLSNLIIFRSDQVVIGATLGVGAIAGYQIAGRVADLFRQLSTQLHDYLGPLAARAHAQGDHEMIHQTLLKSARWVSLLAVLMGLPLAWVLPDLLQIWLNLSDPNLVLCARLLLFSMFVQVSLRSSSTQILLMCQMERPLMWGGMIEALLNLSLSLILASRWGVLGVAQGTLIPNLLMAVFFQLPLVQKASGITPLRYFLNTSGKAWLAGLLASLMIWPLWLQLAALPPVLRIVLGGMGAGLVSLIFVVSMGLTKAEKQSLMTQVFKRMNLKKNPQKAVAA
ncbi:MAG: lipopolysaccharide biosynthesis protein [Candidatus Sericytochromatia bacterium]